MRKLASVFAFVIVLTIGSLVNLRGTGYWESGVNVSIPPNILYAGDTGVYEGIATVENEGQLEFRSGAKAAVLAGQQIRLRHGFKVLNGAEFWAFIDANSNGISDYLESIDGDGDDYFDALENLLGTDPGFASNSFSKDFNGDGILDIVEDVIHGGTASEILPPSYSSRYSGYQGGIESWYTPYGGYQGIAVNGGEVSGFLPSLSEYMDASFDVVCTFAAAYGWEFATRFPTESGRRYAVYGTDDNGSWVAYTNIIYGDGAEWTVYSSLYPYVWKVPQFVTLVQLGESTALTGSVQSGNYLNTGGAEYLQAVMPEVTSVTNGNYQVKLAYNNTFTSGGIIPVIFPRGSSPTLGSLEILGINIGVTGSGTITISFPAGLFGLPTEWDFGVIYFATPPADTPEIIKAVVNGDFPTGDWTSAAEEPLAKLIFAGDDTGDMVSWRVSPAPNGTYVWSATGSENITGPSGSSASEWRIANGDANPADWIAWRPGTYTIKCEITPSSGSPFVLQYQQEVGWRTAQYLVVGQVRPIQDFAPSSGQLANLRAEILEDFDDRYPWYFPYLPGLQIMHELEGLSVENLVRVWFAVEASPPWTLRTVNWPSIGNTEKFWMLQLMLNGNPDTVDLADGDITDGDIKTLKSLESFRMFGAFQTKYTIGPDGLIDQYFELKAPLTKEANAGRTKISASSPFLDFINDIGLPIPNNGSQLLIASEPSKFNDDLQVDRSGGRISFYNSVRVGREAQFPNFALFGRDVPYIFNEIIFGLDSTGRDRMNNIRLSVDKVWQQNGTTTGSVHFNEIRIYKRSRSFELLDFGFAPQGGAFRLDQGAGMLEPFILSVPAGQWPTIPPKPAVPGTVR
ncbi:MAG: hypothetical protein ACREIA_05680 [Opitutaceae bacterium]